MKPDNPTKQTTVVLQEYANRLDGPHRRSFIVRVMDSCGVSRYTVLYWLREDKPLKQVYKRAINEEFRTQLFAL